MDARSPSAEFEDTVVLLAPTRRDAGIAAAVLAEARSPCIAFERTDEFLRAVASGVGMVLLMEEFFAGPDAGRLVEILRAQPSWSAVPLLIFTTPGHARGRVPEGPVLGSAVMLSRPVRMAEMVSAVRAGLSARRRQYEIRDLLAQALQAAEERARLHEEAERANRAKDEFLAMLGHELRNPLAPILTAVQVMKLRGAQGVERERLMIERQARHLVRLVDDLLDVARVTQGKISLRKERVELVDVVAKAIETASPLLEERGQRLEVVIPPQGLWLDADPGRLAQVLANLLNNAAKYSEAGTVIRLVARQEGGDVFIEVRDQGIGIAPDMLSRIFEMFVQGRQALDRAGGGLGLGLSIVRSLIELHGGGVTADSEGVGRGSRFTIRLPAPPAPQPGAGSGQAAASPANGSAAGASYAVLVVDDNVDAAQSLAELLSFYGHRTRVALDGPSALKAADDFSPDVALLDIGLPGMDGYEVAERLRRQPRMSRLRLVALTGYGQQSDVERSRQAGFETHLVKPIDASRLNDILTGAAT